MASKSKEVAKQDDGGAVVPSYLQNYQGRTGAENIDTDDVSIPRIKLGQALTPEVQDGTVGVGDLFLNIDGSVIAKAGEPFRFTPIVTGKEYILWSPDREEGILARAHRVEVNGEARYEWDKQDQTFEVKFPNGPKVKWETLRYVEDNDMQKFGTSIPGTEDSKPAATAHHNYVVALPDHGNMIAAFSLSRSQEKRAKDLNALLKLAQGTPIQARVLTAKSVMEHKGGNDYANYKFGVAGFVESEDQFKAYQKLADSLAEAGYSVDQTNDDGDVAEEGTSI